MDRRHRRTGRAQPPPTPPRPPIPRGLDPDALAAAHDATRALLAAGSPREVVDIVCALVTAIGAVVVPARLAGPDELPLDLSFGVGEPMLAQAEPASIARMHLEVLLPTFVEDARQVVMALRHNAQLRDEATTDPLTGVLNRRAWDRQVHQLRAGDTVALLGFDGVDELTKTAGAPAVEAVLAAFGPLLRDFLRADDLVARYDEHQLVVGTVGGGPQLLAVRFEQLRRVWDAVRPHPVTFSVGVVAVSSSPIQAVREAHEALGADRLAGHDRTQVIA